MLALDGGGTRGIISIAFLKEIEKTLQDKLGLQDDFVLADYFDMIGGTSVGAILATMLAMGWRVDKIERIFTDWSQKVFVRKLTSITNKYDARALSLKIREVVKQEPLKSDILKTGLLIVAKRADTSSVWPLTNNPASKYFADKGETIGNGSYKIHDALRASTAAPTFFHPMQIPIHASQDGREKIVGRGRFVDGAVSPHNNPALMLFKQASLPQYNLGGGDLSMGQGKSWEIGPENLLIISVGAGSYSAEVRPTLLPYLEAVNSLKSIIGDGEQLALALLQAWSEPKDPWHIDGELGDFAGTQMFGDTKLSFQRYELRLDGDWLSGKETRGVIAGPKLLEAIARERVNLHSDLADLRELIEPDQVPLLWRLGQAAAADQVKVEHFPDAFDTTGDQTAQLQSDGGNTAISGNVLTVGVTGHRPNRIKISADALERQCLDVLSLIADGSEHSRLIALTALAEGADRAFAVAALKCAFELHVVLPMRTADYEKTFSDPSAIGEFHNLLAKAAEVRELPGDPARSSDAYAAVGLEIVDRSNVVVAVWDGEPGAGKGGTPDVIEMATRASKPIVWIDAMGMNQARLIQHVAAYSAPSLDQLKLQAVDLMEYKFAIERGNN